MGVAACARLNIVSSCKVVGEFGCMWPNQCKEQKLHTYKLA